MSTLTLPALPSAYTAPAPKNYTSSASNNTQPVFAGKDEARFGACDPCSCPCSCISGIVTAGAVALAGLGLIKLSPKLINSLKGIFSKENMGKLSQSAKQLGDQAKTLGENAQQKLLPATSDIV